MIVNKLKVKSFMSLRDTEVEFPSRGIITIRGKVGDDEYSSNGAGKSATIEAIFWALYGKTLRGANSDKSWEVTIEGLTRDGKKFSITRGKSLDVEIDGVDIKTKLKSELQDIIDRYILYGVSWKTFSILAFFTPFTITRWFSSMSDTEKKDILLEVLNINWLDNIYDKLRNMVTEKESRFSMLSMEKSRIEGEIRGMQDAIRASVWDEAQSIRGDLEFLGKVDSYFKTIDDKSIGQATSSQLQGMYKKVDDMYSEYNNIFASVNAHLVALNEERVRANSTIANLQTDRILFETHNECPTCHRPITEEFKEKKIDEIDEEIKRLNQKLVRLNYEYQTYEAHYKQVASILETIRRVRYSLSRIISMKSQKAHDTMLKDLNQKVEELQTQIAVLEKELDELKKWKEVFSSTGVKSYVVENIFGAIAEKTSEYAELIGLKGLKQSMKKGRITYDNYKSLSSGERRRAEIALMFALRDVIPFPWKILVIDEIFDHLDWKGIQTVVPLIDLQTEDKQIFAISHRPDLGFPNVAKRLLVHKVDGVSTIKEDNL